MENNEGAPEAKTARRRVTRTGVVVSNKMQKTVVVQVERLVTHPLYQRTLRRSTTYMAHDEDGRCQAGDRVLIEECRPLSRRKRWKVAEILRHSAQEKGASS
jgi:small subunit ribosomal protein S17